VNVERRARAFVRRQSALGVLRRATVKSVGASILL
jgi:hypothetical protein